MKKKQIIRVIVIIPTLIVVMVLGAVIYGVMQAGSVNGIEPAVSEDAAMTQEIPQEGEAAAGGASGNAGGEDNMSDQTGEAGTPQDPLSCAFDFLLGQQAEAALQQILPLGRPYRVIGPGDMVTQDFIEERINLQINEARTIIAVTCG